jgi:AbrB family looped-hinge helix DNA binding protein
MKFCIMSDEKRRKAHRFEEHFYGSATVGERGQIVIPADARKRFQIETGDKLLIMGTPDDKGLVLCKIDDIREFMTMFLEGLQNIEKESHESPLEEKAP